VIRRRKIALIGAGNIGGTLALLIGLRNIGDVVLYDVVEGMPQGKALDISHLAPILGCDFLVTGTNDIQDIKDADVCIVTSGIARKPGMSRDDLVKTNAQIIQSVGEKIAEFAPSSFVIVITNPLDAMAYLMYKVTGFSKNKVVGMAGVLDTGRYQAFLAEALNVSVQSVSAFVLGGHGDDMVPVRSYTTCNGIPVGKLLEATQLDAIEQRVRGAGGEVVSLLKTGSAYYSPAAAAVQMVEAYLFDQRRALPAASYLDGEYNIHGIYLGVPIILGKGGVEKVLEIELSSNEQEALKVSASRVAELISTLN
jgi:malate dehydrogenase